ncbi:transcriptional regulator, partial [Klebsiella pneumoniae]|nr:transcriptional regulator [Klebsiella pneumoniae]
ADGSALTPYGREQFLKLGVSLSAHSRRKACCACLDWSERRFHLGGEAGAALLLYLESKGWIQRVAGYREVVVTASGQGAISRHFSR